MLANWSAHGQPGYVEQAPKSYGTWVIGDHGEHCRSPQPAAPQCASRCSRFSQYSGRACAHAALTSAVPVRVSRRPLHEESRRVHAAD